MNKNQLFRIEASIEIGKDAEPKPVNVEPLFACGRHKAAAKAAEIVYNMFPAATRVIVNAYPL